MIFAAICFLCASGASWAQSDAVTVTLSSGNPGATIPSDFSGLSFEEADLLPVSGKYYFVNTNQPLITLFNTLGVTSLRIGGNTADSGTLPANADIDALFGFAEAAKVKVLYALRLKTFNAAAANTTATYIMDHYSADMTCFEIGNEPDLYTSYATYQSEAQTYIDTISASNPTAKFCGPNVSGGGGAWAVSFAQYFASTGKIALVTHHDYPGGPGIATSGAAAREKLLSAGNEANYAGDANVYVPTVLSEGLSYRISEVNSFYNGGSSGCSNTFAEALWDLDYMFWWAGEKAEGLNFHTGDTVSGGTAWYSFFTTTTGGYTVHPGAYGPLAFKLGGHGRIVPVTLSNPSGMDLTAYGVLASDNSLWVTIVNKTIETGSITADLNIDLGGNYSNGNMWLMQAPNNDDSQTTGITLGGGEVGVNGTWSGTSEPVSVFGGTATVILSPASAAVIQFVPGTGGCSAAPSAPTALAATASSSSAIGLTWKAPATIPANCSVIGYKILGGTTANPNAVIGSVSGTTTTFSNTGLTAATTYYYLVEALDADGPSALSNQASASTQAVGTSTEVVSINAGGPAVSDSGGGDNSFVADEDFSAGGTTASTGNTITIPASIAATAAPMAVYQSARQGTVTYTIPGLTAGGSYTVRLHFAEIYFSAAGQRVFDVAINGTAVLTNFDIYATVGAKYTAMVENFTATANSSGDIVIAFTNGTTNQPMFNGIEVLSNSKGVTECSAAPSAPTGLAASGTSSTGTTLSWTADSAPANCTISSYTVLKNGASIGTATGTSFAVTGLSASTAYSFTVEATDSVGTSPASSALDVTTTASGSGGDFIAINSEGPAVSNSGGGDASFAADEDFTGGGKATPTTHAISTTAAGANAAPMAVYQTQRDETFTYTIPGMVANSQHTVLLHFAEIYFSAAGDREFNVAINSTPVLTNFDVYAAAGGEYIAVVKSFTATANSSGQIVIAYTSGAKNQPSAAGLEIR